MEALHGFFSPAAVSALPRAHATRQPDHSRNIYALLMFGLWCDEYLTPRIESEPPETTAPPAPVASIRQP